MRKLLKSLMRRVFSQEKNSRKRHHQKQIKMRKN
jgi:hypothetical protein